MTPKLASGTIGGSVALSRLLAPLAAIVLGLTILAVTGFAAAPVLHNAAHDVRHNTGFPCH